MKKLFLLFILLTCFFGQAQYTAIPDVNFEQALIDLGIDTGAIDGRVLTASVTNLKSLEVPAKSISSLSGIEAFVKLERLNIGTPPNDYGIRNTISTLDLSKNINLIELNCQNNDLTNLDTSTNLFLTSLICINNKISSLDVTKNTALTNLECNKNQITSLDVTKNTALTILECSNNPITSLDVTKNTALINLHCTNNQLSSLDVTKNTALTNLECNNNQIASLDVTKNTALTELEIINNQTTSLDVTKNTALIILHCANNQLSSLDITKNTALGSLGCNSNKINNLDISKNTALRTLTCFSNQISNLDLTNNVVLNTLDCSSNQISNLDLSKNTALYYLKCDTNQISSLDLAKNRDLRFLYCYENKISSLDVTTNSVLAFFNCNNNLLTSLNLKNGNNSIIKGFDSKSNPNLQCIQVDNKAYSDSNWSTKKDATASYSDDCSKKAATIPPIITATGNQTYCPLTNVNIVTNVEITDPDNLGTTSINIQISSGYKNGEDVLTLNNQSSHPAIDSKWIPSEGKLTLTSLSGNPISYAIFEDAIRDIQFSNTNANPSGVRNFSISIGIGQLSYLPRNGHYYEYVPNLGISWTNARNAADARTYYGLKGYLATLTAADEAQLAGKQAPGAGWIGGSDSETEGVWKWMTGPEAGTVFWNGKGNGSTLNYANWNLPNEPNDSRNNEDYAHITDPSIGNPGTWNDLPEQGDPPGPYHPKGYIVEYGGTPGDPILQLSASTTLTIATISSTTPASRCDAGTVTLNATATIGTINWYDALTGGNLLGTGANFTTPTINTTTNYYVETSTVNCSSKRTAVEAKIITTPTVTSTNSPVTHCGPETFTLQATPSVGTINWYSQIGGTIVGTGTSYTTPTISTNTTYYAEAVNSGCINSIKVPVQLIVYPLPAVTDETLKKCVNGTIILDAGIPNMNYLWNTGETTQTIMTSNAGTYTVDVTSPAPQNCTSRKTITIIEDNKPEIKGVKVNETTVTIELVKNEDYFEFSIDGVNYTDSNIFTNAPSGLQTAYVRDTNRCSSDSQPFIVIIIPKFFTPNNDGFNDVWEVKGLTEYPLGEVILFDRYGKLITKLNNYNQSWDGTLNKNPLPSTDYWYVLKLDPNSPEVKGHFSLKR